MNLLYLPLFTLPVPKDIPLPLPAPEWFLITVLIISFLAHILFVNLMLGGSLLTAWYEWKGRREARYDALAKEIAKTITVNKSIAVVMGVAPLLAINTVYTVYFYTANSLTGLAWIMIIPSVATAFLLTYAHKYSWDLLKGHKALHLSISLAANAFFLFIPLIFLANVNLMLLPEDWTAIRGFVSALAYPNVWTRYGHFLLASLAVTGLGLLGYMRRESYDLQEAGLAGFSKFELQRSFYTLAFGASALQFILGPLVLLTLPTKGMGWNLIAVISIGATLALPMLYWLWQELTQSTAANIGRHYYKIVAGFTLVVLFMATGRHLFRANALAPHQALVAQRTADYEALVQEVKAQAEAGLLVQKPNSQETGEQIFGKYCQACHAKEAKLVGPPIVEMHEIYASDEAGLKAWIKQPGKKRPDYPPMPPFPQLSEAELGRLSEYILNINQTEAKPQEGQESLSAVHH